MCRRTPLGGITVCQLVMIVFFLLMAFSAAQGQINQEKPAFAEKIDIIEHLGDTIPLEIPLNNAEGDTVQLADYFGDGRPVILIFHYSDCPMLCSLVLDGVRDALNNMDFTPGKQYQVLTVSLDPLETTVRTRGTQKRYQKELSDKNKTADSWLFFTGAEENVQALTEAIGFKYYYDEKLKQYMHPAAAYILSDEGLISRYLYGIEFNPRDLKLSLLEASEGKVGDTVDRIILYCFHYDPDADGYVVFAANVMRLGGAVTLVALGLLLGILFARDRAKHRAAAKETE
ncbi:SCO family protein [bacterium]|nr:SCO family protein [bacterium]